MSTLNKQIWTDQLMENFYPEVSFLKHVTDMSELVEFDKINLAEVGMDPTVLINNTTYPIGVVERNDNPISIELDLFETENTLIRSPEVVERSYNHLESVLRGHRNSLRTTTGEKAAHAIAPQSDSLYTPVIVTTGADNGTGKKKMTIRDLLIFKARFDKAEIPLDKRFIVLHPDHLMNLLEESLKIFKDVSNYKEGHLMKFAGFNMLEFSRMPKYNVSTGEKVAFGAAPDANDSICSFAFHTDEVMKADGNVKLYSIIDEPKERATTVGFDKRFISMPFRSKGIGAIYSDAV